MTSLKQHLIEDTDKKIKETEEEIKKSDEELNILESKLKVERRMSEMEDIPEGIEEGIKYSIQAIESMILMEKDRNAELKKELEILRYRKQVINKFEDREL